MLREWEDTEMRVFQLDAVGSGAEMEVGLRWGRGTGSATGCDAFHPSQPGRELLSPDAREKSRNRQQWPGVGTAPTPGQ